MHNIIDTAVEAGSFKTLAAAVTAAGLVDTLNGADVKISTEGGVKLNGTSTVTKTDIECTNGVIHVIDTVILPA